ncbi:hypothetical protein M569_05075, partial [Genlisea aurea]
MSERVQRICQVCGSNIGFTVSDDGFFYCDYCCSRAEDIIDTAVDDEEFFSQYSTSHRRTITSIPIPAEPISEVEVIASQFLDHPLVTTDDVQVEGTFDDGLDFQEPGDFGSAPKKFTYEEYYKEIRSRYVKGVQIMIQLQCQALVEKYNASPLIIGLAGPIWLRFLTSSGILNDEWADQAVYDSQVQTQEGLEEFKPSANHGDEPVNIYGKRLVSVWYRSARRSVPISCTLAISFLVCHLAREAITPLDVLNWALEGNIPYFSAFHETGKRLGSRSGACPLPDSYMFRPLQPISSQKLESLAADIAKRISLELPPVNFYSLCFRYCKQLHLLEGKLLPIACRICEWAMPPGLYLSANDCRIPTRAFVMSVLIVAIRIHFDLNGYGICESLSSGSPPCSEDEKDSSGKDYKDSSRFMIMNLLKFFKEKYNKVDDVPEYLSDLPSYLRYCKEMVFAGLWPSYEDAIEENLINELWDFYKSKVFCTPSLYSQNRFASLHSKEKTVADLSSQRRGEEPPFRNVLVHLKSDMEENGFCYIPPRVRIKSRDYLYYARKRRDVYRYAVHADYYILVRSCAMVAQVETRIMHIAVLITEKRLDTLEKRI